MNTRLKLLASLSITILMIGCSNTKALPAYMPHSFILADTTYGAINDIETVHEISQIKVRLEHGGYQTVTQAASDLHVGDRVRVEKNQVLLDLKP